MTPGQAAILIPTFDRYLWLARLTRGEIERRWSPHPPIFYCGVSSQEPDFLPLQDDPSNWVAILQHATENLIERGFDMVYLILDDHPPLARCHAEHLNETLPRLMQARSAAYIGLQGWDHKRRLSGQILGAEFFRLMQLDPKFTSKFGLHPALWHLDALVGILTAIRAASPPAITPWDFERLTGLPDAPFPDAWKRSAYRICGRVMAADPSLVGLRSMKDWINGGLRNLHDTLHVLTGPQFRTALADRTGLTHQRAKEFKRSLKHFFLKFGYKADWIKLCTRKKIRKAAEHLLGFDNVYYEGPYPLYFTGILRRGGVNPHLRAYLRQSKDPAHRSLLDEIDRHCPPPPLGGSTDEAQRELR